MIQNRFFVFFSVHPIGEHATGRIACLYGRMAAFLRLAME